LDPLAGQLVARARAQGPLMSDIRSPIPLMLGTLIEHAADRKYGAATSP
jgi:hypothetical protein